MYTRKQVVKLEGKECFINTNGNTIPILNFWQYGFSNLNSNILRGVLAEFIVESALRDQKEITVRNPWGDYDVEYKGKKIEVKSCSYLQDWDQNKLSVIQWAGLKAKTIYWSDAVSAFKTNETKEYKSDIYVLCLLKHKEPGTSDIMNLDQWCFYVISKEDLKRISKDREAVSLTILEKSEIIPVSFAELKNKIESI